MLQVASASAGCALAYFVDEHFRPSKHQAKRLWIPASILPPGIAIGFVNVQYPVIAGFLILFLAEHGNSGPAAFSAYALTVLCSRFFLGRLPDRIHPSITFYSGLFFMACGLIWLGTAPRPFFAVTAAIVLGFGFSFPWASVASTVLRRTPSQEHGYIIGLLSAFYDLFVGLSSFAAGAITKHFGYPPAFYMAAGSLIVAAIAGRFVFFPAVPPVYPAATVEQLETAV
jgi:MFS family permease